MMSTSPTSILRRNVSSETFEQICSLCEQVAGMTGEEAIFLTEAALPSAVKNSRKDSLQKQRFCLVASPEFQVLLVGEPSNSHLSYQIQLTWDGREINQFLAQFPIDFTRSLLPQQRVQSGHFYSEFSLRLINLLAPPPLENIENIYPQVSVCKPVEDALERQVVQERLLNQVIAQLHQTLDLSVILETAVREVRNCFQSDRLLIYQFQCQSNTLENSNRNILRSGAGKVTYESKIDNSLSSLLNYVAEEDCFKHIPHCHQKYLNGCIVGVEDVESAYSASFCLVEFLRQYQIKSKLIAPIIVQDELWGLIVVHQCFEKRQWLEREKDFLGQIAEHLAVAIYQAQLYAAIQEQKDTFEQRVIERTRELRDTLLAAQAAHRSKSEFLGNVSHELRTPLTSIIGLSGTLLHSSQKEFSLSPEKQQRYLKIIQESGQQLLNLINEMIDFSQIEAGKTVLNTKEISLYKLAQKMRQVYQKESQRKNIELKLDFRVSVVEDNFFTDPERLQQILFHLFDNAIKFTADGGIVLLRIWREKHYAVFQVEDTGIGISEQQLPLLFKKFQQLEKSRERSYGGTGLGLALTKQLVELHQGRIEVESTLGTGSRFTVWLPNQNQRFLKSAALTTPEIPAFPKNKNIILVANDEETANLMCELLTAGNYQVVWLIDGLTAIQQIELLQPNAVIIDCDLPEVYIISQSLKRSPMTRSLKILLLSQQISAKDWQAIQQYGIDDYLLKPIEPNHFLQRVNALL